MSKNKNEKSNFKVDKSIAQQRVKAIWPILKKTYPDARTSLDHTNALELLIATIMAAQCTDVRVNIVTKTLFKKYKSAKDWVEAPIEQIEQDIKSTGFYKNKAINIKTACQKIIDNFGGKVPDNMKDLLTLNGVGRKTANVVLGNAYGIPGIVCDTHVIRLSRRLQLSVNSDPVKLEFDLMEIVPQKNWTHFSHLLVFHGRSICQARKPKCEICPIAKHCPAANNPKLW
ncbi:MAG: endonuclease III [Planctomycetes bacterium GWF2_41_51]|nr:MAG: endonuclease III [Planctomycetes bacterium GWF2_41_51]HBG28478.1 endonuclease III [Phycisphaerales bacterium]